MLKDLNETERFTTSLPNVDARELRIGNYLLHSNRNGNFSLPVVEILQHGVNLDFNNGAWFVPYSELNPIETTAVILEQSGFTNTQGSYSINGFYPSIHNFDGKWVADFGTSKVDLPYVHHVQNLHFAHVGEELIISL